MLRLVKLIALSITLPLACLFAALLAAAEPDHTLSLKSRQRVKAKPDGEEFKLIEKPLSWEAKKTALVICDMWDKHWCAGATKRVGEMAPRMNEVVKAARDKGVLIIHCPSSCMEAYKDTPMRKLAQAAPKAEPKVPLQAWCRIDPKHEAALPIDDADGGCDCWPRCAGGSPWRRQIDTIEMKEQDAITDSAEAYYLMKERGIENVIVMGVHTNMCVLGRPFSIRQLVYQGQSVVLMRDMTDTMYNSRSKPYVPHCRGTDLVVEHIEKFWCPTITSTDFTGKSPFTFAEDGKPHVVFALSEPEYKTGETLPVFAREHLEPRGIRCTILHGDSKDGNLVPGLEALKTADLLFLSMRRRALPAGQLALVREYVTVGKPLVAIRTASHAFDTKGTHPEGHDEWRTFDPDVLGGNYTGHHGAGPKSTLTVAEGATSHAILSGVVTDKLVGNGSLYKSSPLAKTATPLLIGTIPDKAPEPVAWTNTHNGGRVFYTSLGHVEDFQNPEFNKFMVNAVTWALAKDAARSTPAPLEKK